MKQNVHDDSFPELYRSGKHTNTELSRIFGVAVATIGNWAQREGLPPRKRGRPRLMEPSATQRAILELLRRHEPADVAARIAVSRQYVHQVQQKWGPSSCAKGPAPQSPVSVMVNRCQREIKSRVVSFRITNSEFDELRLRAIALGSSPNHAARHLVLLYIGRRQLKSGGGRAVDVILGQGTKGSTSET